MRRNYDDEVYKEWRRRVRKRDGNMCQMPQCGYKKYLQVHHIRKWSNAPSLRYDVDNGITLCKNCHNRVNKCEALYQGLFMDIVRWKSDKRG
jgi:5-methylcytosine-specific restriction endonuclease McrA